MVELKKSASWAILSQLAEQDRRILSEWRALLLLRRATEQFPPEQRRWKNAPSSLSGISQILGSMMRRGEIRRLPDLAGIYEVIVPYARRGLIQEDEILMEVHPYAALSHHSALVFHGLTDDLPNEINAIYPTSGGSAPLPTGTTLIDWTTLELVPGQPVSDILGQPVRWIPVDGDRYFGLREYLPRGYPVRVTTPERTLLDALQRPELCGGVETVLQAWARSRDLLDLDELISDVGCFDDARLRQRVGYLLDELGFFHSVLEGWRRETRPGEPSKLVVNQPYSSPYSDRWNLSLNAPVAVLQESG